MLLRYFQKNGVAIDILFIQDSFRMKVVGKEEMLFKIRDGPFLICYKYGCGLFKRGSWEKRARS